jgi:hypothetical protein
MWGKHLQSRREVRDEVQCRFTYDLDVAILVRFPPGLLVVLLEFDEEFEYLGSEVALADLSPQSPVASAISPSKVTAAVRRTSRCRLGVSSGAWPRPANRPLSPSYQ